MANNLRKFNTYSDYEAAELVKPAVSLIAATDEVIFDQKDAPVPPTPPTPSSPKWIATYSDSHTESAECDSSSVITMGDITKDDLVSIEIGDCVTSIDNDAFSYCSSLTSVTIPNSVTTIGRSVFYNCSSLTSIEIPSGVTSIGNYAFYGSSLSSIDIPNGVTSIGENVFNDCTSLTSCTIGSGVTTIGDNAFSGCYNLTSINISADTAPQLGDYVFNGISDYGTLNTPEGSTGYCEWKETESGLADWTISGCSSGSGSGSGSGEG